MKWFLWIAILISVTANGYFVYDETCVKQNQEQENFSAEPWVPAKAKLHGKQA